MVFDFSPSSTPVNTAWSLFLSNTCTFSMFSALMFLVATVGSEPKNSSPSTNTFLTVCPCAVIFPSLSTCMPGNFFSKASTVLFLLVRKLSTKYSVVSPLMRMAASFSLIITCLSRIAFPIINISPRFLCSFSLSTNSSS